ncbi:hypothetical protein GALL_379240 [mine drainage metagenome]|uniref:Uncharacterized protein n=1 Tax=mine drainage metagenome TaxID=410659 RepID=A0A1J5QAW2_9ZZZZ
MRAQSLPEGRDRGRTLREGGVRRRTGTSGVLDLLRVRMVDIDLGRRRVLDRAAHGAWLAQMQTRGELTGHALDARRPEVRLDGESRTRRPDRSTVLHPDRGQLGPGAIGVLRVHQETTGGRRTISTGSDLDRDRSDLRLALREESSLLGPREQLRVDRGEVPTDTREIGLEGIFGGTERG